MPLTVDPNDFTPRYYQLARILQERIASGELKPYQAIPSERQLEEIYAVSRTTIRQAIDHLVRQGYLFREHGRGTFVSPEKLQKGISELTSFSEDMKRRGLQPGQQILDMGFEKAPAKILTRLGLPADHRPLLKIKRIRLGDGAPMGLQTSYYDLPAEVHISREDLEAYGSIYALLQEKYHVIPTEADETLEVTLATPEEAAFLQVKAGSPLLLSERIMYSQTRKPVEYVIILYRGDRYRYYAKLTR